MYKNQLIIFIMPFEAFAASFNEYTNKTWSSQRCLMSVWKSVVLSHDVAKIVVETTICYYRYVANSIAENKYK
jgi:hypothetical protein